jgi:hypothetical protein
MSDPHPELVEELILAEDTQRVLGALGSPLESWEALRLARTEGDFLRREVERLDKQLQQGRKPGVGGILVEALQRIRLSLYRRVQVLKERVGNSGIALDPRRRETLVAILVAGGASPLMAEWELGAWVERTDKLLIELQRRMAAGPPSAVPAGLDADVLEDLRAADRFMAYQDAKTQKIEFWEVFRLAVEDRLAAGRAADRMRRGAPADDLNADLITFLERILKVKGQDGVRVRSLREYVAKLPIGRYNKDLMELAIAFTMAHPEARTRVGQWLEMPDHWKREAAIRFEGVIGKAQKYQQVLRAVSA